MNRDEFYTISQKTVTSLVVQKSRFIALAYPIKNEQHITCYMQEIRREYPGATHYCYAYILGLNQQKIKYSDDGEPSGTAGLPIYNQLRSHRLVNSMIVVVRYFGGIQLGIKGLRQAYGEAALKVLKQCNFIIYRDVIDVSIFCSYEKLHFVLTILKRYNALVIQQDISMTCSIQCQIEKNDVSKIQHELRQYATVVYKTE